MNDRGIRILVCDDQDLIRAGYTTILSAQPGFDVVGQAGDGAEAVRLAARLQPDVVVMDVRMPVMDGIEATRRIVEADQEQAEQSGADAGPVTRVLVVTTFNLDEYVFEALRAGASGFLLKDTPVADLVAGVRTVAAGNALLAPEVTRGLIGRFAERVRGPDGTAGGSPAVLEPLTDREVEVLRWVAKGSSNAEIAAVLFISPETVKTHVSRILAKLDLRDRVQAVVLAHRIGLVPAPP